MKKKCMNVKVWNAYGSYERCQLTLKTVEFLRKVLSYAEEFPQLSEEIFTPSTVDSVMKVLPEILFHKIRDSKEYDGNPSSRRVSLSKICLNKILENKQKPLM